jgi:hypothetical protein
MSWLKTFGQVMAKVGAVAAAAAGFEPLLGLVPGIPGATLQKVNSTFGNIVKTIGTVEAVSVSINAASTGADRLKAATPLVAEILKGSEELAGRTIKDQAKHDAAVTAITSAVADLLNSY